MGSLDGITRDKDGIVLSRRDVHPLAYLFRALPSGLDGTYFTLPPEIHHLLAIHIFDNLDCSPPRAPKYKYREAANAQHEGQGGDWVPDSAPDEDYAAAAFGAAVEIPGDIDEWSQAKRDAVKLAIRAAEIKSKMVQQADPAMPDSAAVPVASTEPVVEPNNDAGGQIQ